MMYPRRRKDVRRAYLCRGGRVRVDLACVRASGTGRGRTDARARQDTGSGHENCVRGGRR